MMVIGDSFGLGQTFTGGTSVFRPGYLSLLSEMLQLEDMWGCSIGSTGILRRGSGGTTPNFRDRVATDVIPYAPDIILIQGSINDIGNYTPTEISAEIPILHSALKIGLPDVHIIACSPLQSKASIVGTAEMTAAQKTSWQALGVPFIDLTGINTGTGHEVTPTGAGTSDINLSGDATHPSWPAGYEQIATLLAPKISAVLKSIA
jgi:lysophospholipase L1-like esterase